MIDLGSNLWEKNSPTRNDKKFILELVRFYWPQRQKCELTFIIRLEEGLPYGWKIYSKSKDGKRLEKPFLVKDRTHRVDVDVLWRKLNKGREIT